MGEVIGEGTVSILPPAREFGECCKLPSWALGRALAANILGIQMAKTLRGEKILSPWYFLLGCGAIDPHPPLWDRRHCLRDLFQSIKGHKIIDFIKEMHSL